MIKVERSFPAPKSLAIEKNKPGGVYNGEDVVTQLKKDFSDKCYICEMKPVFDINIEHLNPHRNNIDLKFDWNNLFYSCVHCNSMKKGNKYAYKILDCCEKDPEKYLLHIFENGHVVVKPVDESTNDEIICLTGELITDCFENKNTPIRTIQCENRANELGLTMLALYKNLEKYSKNPNGAASRALKGMLKRTYKFAGFTRTYVRMHLEDYPDLEKYIV